MTTKCLLVVSAVLLCLAVGCGEDVPQKSIVRLRGMWSNPNDAGIAPDGALAQADDVSLARPGIAEPRRGFSVSGAAGGAINAWAEFGGQLVAHIGTNTVKRS